MYSTKSKSLANHDFKLANPPKRRARSSPPVARNRVQDFEEPLNEGQAVDNIEEILGDLIWNLPIAVQARRPQRLRDNFNFFRPTGDIIFEPEVQAQNVNGDTYYAQPPILQERCFCGGLLKNGEELFIFWPCAHRYVSMLMIKRGTLQKPQSGKERRVVEKSCIILKRFHFSFSAHRNCWRRRKLENRAKVFFRCEYAFCQHLITEDSDFLFNHECLLLRQISGWRFYKDWYKCTEMLPQEEEDVTTLIKNMIWFCKWKWNPNYDVYHDRNSLVGEFEDIIQNDEWDNDVGSGLAACMTHIRKRSWENGTEYQFQIDHRKNRLPLSAREVTMTEFFEPDNGWVEVERRNEVYTRLGDAMRRNGMANLIDINGSCLEFCSDRAIVYRIKQNPANPLIMEAENFSDADEDDNDDGQGRAEEPRINGFATRPVQEQDTSSESSSAEGQDTGPSSGNTHRVAGGALFRAHLLEKGHYKGHVAENSVQEEVDPLANDWGEYTEDAGAMYHEEAGRDEYEARKVWQKELLNREGDRRIKRMIEIAGDKTVLEEMSHVDDATIHDGRDNEVVTELFRLNINHILDEYANGRGDPRLFMHYFDLLEGHDRLRRVILDKSEQPTIEVPHDDVLTGIGAENLKVVRLDPNEAENRNESAGFVTADGLGASSLLSMIADEPSTTAGSNEFLRYKEGYVEWSRNISRNYSLIRFYENESTEGSCLASSSPASLLCDVSPIARGSLGVSQKKEFKFKLLRAGKVNFSFYRLQSKSSKSGRTRRQSSQALQAEGCGSLKAFLRQFANQTCWTCQLFRCTVKDAKTTRRKRADCIRRPSLVVVVAVHLFGKTCLIRTPKICVKPFLNNLVLNHGKSKAVLKKVSFCPYILTHILDATYYVGVNGSFFVFDIKKYIYVRSDVMFQISEKTSICLVKWSSENKPFYDVYVHMYVGVSYIMYKRVQSPCSTCHSCTKSEIQKTKLNVSTLCTSLYYQIYIAEVGNFCVLFYGIFKSCQYICSIMQRQVANLDLVQIYDANHRFLLREAEVSVLAQRSLYSEIVSWNEAMFHYGRLDSILERGILQLDPDRISVRGEYQYFKAHEKVLFSKISPLTTMFLIALSTDEFKDRVVEFTGQLTSQIEVCVLIIEMLPVDISKVLDLTSYFVLDFKLLHILKNHLNEHHKERIMFNNNKLGYVLKRSIRRLRSAIGHFLVYGLGEPGFFKNIVQEHNFATYLTVMEAQFHPRRLLTPTYYNVAKDYLRSRQIALEALDTLGIQEHIPI